MLMCTANLRHEGQVPSSLPPTTDMNIILNLPHFTMGRNRMRCPGLSEDRVFCVTVVVAGGQL